MIILLIHPERHGVGDVENDKRLRHGLRPVPGQSNQQLHLAGPASDDFQPSWGKNGYTSVDDFDEASITGEQLQAVVSGVGDDDVSVGKRNHAAWFFETAGVGTDTADRLPTQACVDVPDG